MPACDFQDILDLELDSISVDMAEEAIAPAPQSGTGRSTGPTRFSAFVFGVQFKWTEVSLPVDEETALIKRAKSGDSQAIQALSRRLQPFYDACVQEITQRHPHLEAADLLSNGHMGLSDALRRFEADNNASFATYARFWIAGRMLEMTKKYPFGFSGGSPRTAPPCDADMIDVAPLANTIVATPSVYADTSIARVMADVTAEAYAGASPRQREMFAFLSEDGREQTLDTIGTALGVSKERARQLQDACFRRIREALAKRGVHTLDDILLA